MSDVLRLKYEKPVAIDLGRVAPVLGESCSNGQVAADGCLTGGTPAGCYNGNVNIITCSTGGNHTGGPCGNGGQAVGCANGAQNTSNSIELLHYRR